MNEREHLHKFASGLAHEVRNPLNSIGLQLSLLERRTKRLRGRAPGELRESIGIIRDEVRRIDALVSELLLLSQTRCAGFRETDFSGLIDDVAQVAAVEAARAGVRIERRTCGKPAPRIWTDVDRIKIAALGILRQAAFAMPDGGDVVVETGLVDDRVCLRVTDHGPGWPEGLDVFQPFARTNRCGTGLELPIAQQIVLDHGGEISAQSRAGHGTTFTIHLPVSRPESAVVERRRRK